MPGALFKENIRMETGITWEEWVVKLQRSVNELWSHEEIRDHVCRCYGVSGEWGEWLAAMYAPYLGRTPVGVTKDAGVQIGVRKTVAISVPLAWNYLTSREGLALWIGSLSAFPLEKGAEFASAEGITGKLTVVDPFRKLRMTWKRKEWPNPSRLQITFTAAKSGGTTISIHQEMLDDVYMRELMRREWESVLNRIQELGAEEYKRV
ncbi:SRPBCC domain-containing protein [Paenibacillus chitinolyticus]|uniref:SRPBCC family protein n=1 Tax=Paenibacillus chitinolyticus TaxID=79263 RepID=UPI0035D77523